MSAEPGVRAGGCIRLYPSGPQWHVNTMHALIGFSGEPYINPVNGWLSIELAPPHLPVLAAYVLPDETLVNRRIMAGVSGGVSACNVLLSDSSGRLDLRNPADYAKVAGEGANLWCAVLGMIPAPKPEPEPTPPAPPTCGCHESATYDDMASLRRADIIALRAFTDLHGCPEPQEG